MNPVPAPSDGLAAPRAGLADRLSRMIQVRTISAEADANTAAFAAFPELLAECYPLVHEQLTLERIGPLGLVYRWDGSGPGAPVVLMAHWDVVPVTGQDDWTVDPFTPTLRDGVLWGRGVLDDKGTLCVLLEAVENLLATDFTPNRTVYLCLGGDEETDGAAGREIAETLHARGVTPWLVLDEGGAITDLPLPGLSGQFAVVGLGEKGVMTVELKAIGTGGHASAPPRLTAVTRLGRAVSRLARNPFPPRLPTAFRQLLGEVAPRASGVAGPLLRLAAALPWVTARLLVRLGGELAAMVRTTVAPTMLDGGSAPNVLPAAASAIVNLRVSPGETVETVRRRLSRAIGDREVSVTVRGGYDPTPESPTDVAQFGLIRRAVDASYPGVPTVPYLTMAATDARHWHRFSPAVYRFSPLAISAAERASIHGANERVAVESLLRGEQFYRALLTAIPTEGDRQ